MEKYGLIFDMDGVLADTETLIARASIDMFRELYKAELTADDFRPFIGTGVKPLAVEGSGMTYSAPSTCTPGGM